MSDIVKWGLLAAAIVILGSALVALPVVLGMDSSAFNDSITAITDVARSYFSNFRGLINNFLTPAGRTILSGVFIYILAKPILLYSFELGVSVYRFIFK